MASNSRDVEKTSEDTPRIDPTEHPEIERLHSYHLDDYGIYRPYSYDVYDPGQGPRQQQPSSSGDTLNDETEKRTRTEKEVENGDLDLERGETRKSRRTLSNWRSTSRAKTPPLEREPTRGEPNVVSFTGPEDKDDPKNWSYRTKWGATFIVSSFTFISPVSSSMIAPALPAISQEFGITQSIEMTLTLSIFVLAYAIGPLILGPLSEIYGRVPVLQLANLFYLIWNLGCGAATSKGQMIAFRFLAGLGGSAPLAIGGGVLSDLWTADQRGQAVAIYSLAPLLGPAVGPIAGAWIAETTSWRYCFWSTSVVDAIIQIAGLFFLRETYAPKILARKTAKLRKETGNDKLRSEYDRSDRTKSAILSSSLIRPFKLLGTQPIVQALSLYMAYLYGLLYLVLATFSTLFTDQYGMSVGIGGLNYISIGLGAFVAAQVGSRFNDRIYRQLKAKNNGKGEPEFRVPLMFVGAALVPIGLFWYGWSAQAKVHWIMPDIGALLLSAGVIIGFQCIQSYLVDAYTRYAASAIGAAACLRSLAGFGFPLFAPYMFDTLHYGWGGSVLGFVAIALGIPAPILLWRYGADLRAKSPFAAGAR